MNLAQQILEMAAAYRSEFEPGYRVFVRREHGEVPSMGRYVVGTSGKDRGLFYVASASAFPSLVPDERIQKLLGRKITSFEEVEEEVIQALLNNGYEDITEVDKSGTSTYFGGDKVQEGTMGPFNGTLYHGTPDVFFFTTTYGSEDLGQGSHLRSLQEGGAFSLTPNIGVAQEFATQPLDPTIEPNPVGMIIEGEAHLNIYYASRAEDDLDEIDYPEEADAVAIPYGAYEEDEIALLRWGDNFTTKAVHLETPQGWKRYPIDESHIVYFGEFAAFLGDYLADCFGPEMNEVFDLLEVHNFDPNNQSHLNQDEPEYIVLHNPQNSQEFCLLSPVASDIIYFSSSGESKRFVNAKELLSEIRTNPPDFFQTPEEGDPSL